MVSSYFWLFKIMGWGWFRVYVTSAVNHVYQFCDCEIVNQGEWGEGRDREADRYIGFYKNGVLYSVSKCYLCGNDILCVMRKHVLQKAKCAFRSNSI